MLSSNSDKLVCNKECIDTLTPVWISRQKRTSLKKASKNCVATTRESIDEGIIPTHQKASLYLFRVFLSIPL